VVRTHPAALFSQRQWGLQSSGATDWFGSVRPRCFRLIFAIRRCTSRPTVLRGLVYKTWRHLQFFQAKNDTTKTTEQMKENLTCVRVEQCNRHKWSYLRPIPDPSPRRTQSVFCSERYIDEQSLPLGNILHVRK
jgi:hypothetical protein